MINARVLYVLALLVLTVICSCSQKVPQLSDPEYGMIAIPLKVVNTTPTQHIVFRYELTSTVDQEVVIPIEPKNFEHFVFSNPVPPGTYYVNQMIGYNRKVHNTNTSVNHWNYKPTQTITVTVMPGTFSVPHAEIEIHQFRDSDGVFKTICDIDSLPKETLGEYIDRLQAMVPDGTMIWTDQ